jgi:hypothetical protein
MRVITHGIRRRPGGRENTEKLIIGAGVSGKRQKILGKRFGVPAPNFQTICKIFLLARVSISNSEPIFRKRVSAMKARFWKNRIVKSLRQVNIDPGQYQAVIDTLSDILEQRDAIYKQYVDEGSVPIIEYTNKGGATNTVKNPLLVTWADLNTQSLAYWKELGLTPASYKKMTGGKPAEKKSALVDALQSLA